MATALVSSLAPEASDGVVLHLFNGPYVTVRGQRSEVPEGAKRLLAFVTLMGGRAERRLTAGSLWPETDDERAAGNLRSALWRLRGAGLDLLDCDKATLSVRSGTVIDLVVVCAWATRLISGTENPTDLVGSDSVGEVSDLLPGWYDDWIVFERERIRQRLVHALEALSRRLVREGRHADAIEAALRAVAVDPLRESAVRVLIEAHLAEGNLGEARRVYGGFARVLTAELGVRPSLRLSDLVNSDG